MTCEDFVAIKNMGLNAVRVPTSCRPQGFDLIAC